MQHLDIASRHTFKANVGYYYMLRYRRNYEGFYLFAGMPALESPDTFLINCVRKPLWNDGSLASVLHGDTPLEMVSAMHTHLDTCCAAHLWGLAVRQATRAQERPVFCVGSSTVWGTTHRDALYAHSSLWWLGLCSYVGACLLLSATCQDEW